jgi:cyclic pyranopterin monophosphate synthase
MDELTHTDSAGKAAMVDISAKEEQFRSARASGHIRLTGETLDLIRDNQVKKGDVLAVARIAGINAAKQTYSLIPLCHNILINFISVDLIPDETGITAESEVHTIGRTGAEMEAITAVSVALLTVYDMCKAVDRMMVIDKILLTEKTKR